MIGDLHFQLLLFEIFQHIVVLNFEKEKRGKINITHLNISRKKKGILQLN